jgi:hypothetical protein
MGKKSSTIVLSGLINGKSTLANLLLEKGYQFYVSDKFYINHSSSNFLKKNSSYEFSEGFYQSLDEIPDEMPHSSG